MFWCDARANHNFSANHNFRLGEKHNVQWRHFPPGSGSFSIYAVRMILALSSELDELLAEVLALQQTDKRLRRILQAVGDGFAVLDFSLGHVSG